MTAVPAAKTGEITGFAPRVICHDFDYVSGVSPEMRPVQQSIREIAPTDIPVLVTGESGTGKEMAALQIHRYSRYRNQGFLKVSCAAMTPESLEKLCQAQNGHLRNDGGIGTLFLDEIAELDDSCQRHLLHAVPDGNGVPWSPLPVGRILSCTTREIESEVQSGRLRSELFYRLNGVCVQLPPLRRRREDIPLLVRHFVSKYTRMFQRPEMTIRDRTMQLFSEYPWPGNIRQLENVVKRIVATENEELAIADLKVSPATAPFSRIPIPARSLKAASRAASLHAERELILQTLEKTHWNRKRAAQALQISYKSLLFKLKQIQMPESESV